ncbi:hypothetical protein F4604DRAFT_1996991 [Suillus subluteus]|nr:hypothetical protein F4604DRAFT_1996991 [Suillus subluteus]
MFHPTANRLAGFLLEMSVLFKMRLKLFARNERQMLQWITAPEKAAATTPSSVDRLSAARATYHNLVMKCNVILAVDEENYELRFVTHPELEEDFKKAEEEQREKDKADAEKQAKKKTEDEARHTQIERNIESKTFDAVSTLRRKDDFIAVAGALKISRDGTVEELRTRIKEFLADAANQHFADNPRFAALFQTGKTRSQNKNLATASSTGQASSGASQDNDATSSNTSVTHFFTPPASAHSFNPYYPPYFTNQPYFHQFYANPALRAPSYSTTQHNNSSGGSIASSSNLDRQPQRPYNTHSLPTHPPQFYNYGTNHGHPRT